MKFTRIMLCCVFGLSALLIVQSCATETKASEAENTNRSLRTKSKAPVVATHSTTNETSLVWHTIDQIEKLQAKNPEQSKKVIVDVYTNWCRWCKVMDEKTFTDAALIKYLNDNYYMVKFNAEIKEELTFKGKKYAYKGNGRKGFNSLAAELTQGKLSYPSFVILDEQLNTLQVTRGFKNAQQFKQALENINPI